MQDVTNSVKTMCGDDRENNVRALAPWLRLAWFRCFRSWSFTMQTSFRWFDKIFQNSTREIYV